MTLPTSTTHDLPFYDVVIIGAGPAGGQCARELAQAGKKILIAERAHDFHQNNFSSAGSVLETLRDFQLPNSVIGGRWKSIRFVTASQEYAWTAQKPRGIVFDFAALRQFLIDEAKKNGAQVHMGCQFQKRWYDQEQKLHVQLMKNKTSFEVITRVLVDATGPARAVMYEPGQTHPQWSSTPGAEYLIRVKTSKTKRFIDPSALYIFISNTWAPAGYSWIFPMQEGIFKFGVGANAQRYNAQAKEPMSSYIDLLLKEYIGEGGYEILDKHGGIVRGTRNRDDKYVDGKVIAIGDTVSTIYPIAGEGVRHALHSGRIGAESIIQYLDGKKSDLVHYEAAMKRYLSWKWWIGEQFMQYFHRTTDAQNNFDPWLRALRKLSLEEFVDVLFFYRFEKLIKVLLP